MDAGRFQLLISPARAAGVMTSRFTATATGAGLEQVYRQLPTVVAGALPVQLSFGSAYPYGENIVRVPAYLPHVLPLGEHRGAGDGPDAEVIGLEDVALTATRDRLHLVSLSRRQVIEPQVFHALALDKQPPPLARFLGRLSRGFGCGWTAFDWGPLAAELPYLPRVRYQRTILAAARWRIAPDELPGGSADPDWRARLAAWRCRWRCPPTVELRDEDRTVRLDLDQPLHAAILHAHLARHDEAVLTETPEPDEFGWIGGHAHEIAVPLVTTRPPAPAPRLAGLPVLNNRQVGQMPGAADTRWLHARLHTHPDRHDEIIAGHLPALVDEVGADVWFLRYRHPDQIDHLRLRVRVDGPVEYGRSAAAVGAWTDRLRAEGLAGWLVLDTYVPEVGRYGTGLALDAAEAVFVADSRLAVAQLRPWRGRPDLVAVTAVNMAGIVVGLLGTAGGMRWLIDRPVPAGPAPERPVADAAVSAGIRLVNDGSPAGLPGWPDAVIDAWHDRAGALTSYRAALDDGPDLDTVVESLLHMHHNRVRGIDPTGEDRCRRLARQVALSWQARHTRGSR